MGTLKEINIKNRTYYFYNNIDLENFDSSLLKIDKKSYKTLVLTTVDISQLKKLMILKIFTVWILCIYWSMARVDISKKKGWINT